MQFPTCLWETEHSSTEAVDKLVESVDKPGKVGGKVVDRSVNILSELSQEPSQQNVRDVYLLDRIRSRLALAGDIAHAQVTMYVREGAAQTLLVFGQARPRTSFLPPRPVMTGVDVAAAEEPLVWRSMESGEAITGQREVSFGLEPLFMQTFPVRNAEGTVIAVVSFEMSGTDSLVEHAVLLETVLMLLVSEHEPKKPFVYRPIYSQDGVLATNERGQIIFANAAAISIFQLLGVGTLLGRRIHEKALHLRIALKAFSAGQPQETEVDVGGIVLSEKVLPVLQNGRSVRLLVFLADITQIRKKEKELQVKSAVIQEIHHRVKNNLQTIASLLQLQARRTEFPEVRAALRDSVNRIQSISVVHEFLSQQDEEYIDIADVSKHILGLVVQSMVAPGFEVEKRFEAVPLVLPSEQAGSLALVVNELVQNAIEHGFAGRQAGVIGLRLTTPEGGGYRLEIYDDGVGLPADFENRRPKSLGLQIVRTLVETDLSGTFELFSKNGTHAVITVATTEKGA